VALRTDLVGDWSDVVIELPGRIAQWLPRLAAEGIVGADAIFACLGPALEIFSRYSHVERADGRRVTLREYLEIVWTEVAKQALKTIFLGADASAFDPASRLTVMWLWTLSTSGTSTEPRDEEDAEGDDEEAPAAQSEEAYALDYDTARKVAMSVGADLTDLTTYVEVKGNSARLIPVEERAERLFAAQQTKLLALSGKKKRAKHETAAPQEAIVLTSSQAWKNTFSHRLIAPLPGSSSTSTRRRTGRSSIGCISPCCSFNGAARAGSRRCSSTADTVATGAFGNSRSRSPRSTPWARRRSA